MSATRISHLLSRRPQRSWRYTPVYNLREGAERATLRTAVQRIVDTVDSEFKGVTFGGGVGRIVEDEKKLSVFFRWLSVEVRPLYSDFRL